MKTEMETTSGALTASERVAGAGGAEEQSDGADAGSSLSRRSWARRMLRNPLGLAGAAFVLVWVLGAVLAPAAGPCCPLNEDLINRLQAPGAGHPLGTDSVGQDVLAAVLYGGRISLSIGLATVVLGLVVGLAIGLTAGLVGGLVDEVLMRTTDLVLAFPIIILVLGIDAALGPSLVNDLVALGAVWWPAYARVTRTQVLSLRETTFVEAARALGLPTWRIALRDILPNMIAPLLVLATLDIGNAILTIAALGFLGLGVNPSTPEWGYMISAGREYADQWWVSLFPGVAIFTSIMGCNFFGDALRDALDPLG